MRAEFLDKIILTAREGRWGMVVFYLSSMNTEDATVTIEAIGNALGAEPLCRVAELFEQKAKLLREWRLEIG